MAHAVQAAVKPKFRGRETLRSKVAAHYPENLEREYERITNTYMVLLNQTLAEYLPKIRSFIYESRTDMRADSSTDVFPLISQIFFMIKDNFVEKEAVFDLSGKIESLANQTHRMSVRQWKKTVHNTLGVDILEDYYMGEFYREALTIWTQDNVGLIKTIPRGTLVSMQNIVEMGYQTGKSNTAIGKEIQEAYGIEKRHAQFIARDQMAKLNADITRTQQKDAGIEEYEWSTSRDSRVRERHKELDGKRFKWGHPPIVDKRTMRRGEPGEDYNCRCVALPIFNIETLNLPWQPLEAA
jgi:SPP1 gp7 family putative phage head morphogenesis protein